MSTFKVIVTLVDNIIPIEGADFIELAQIQDFYSIVKKGDFRIDDKVAYIPEDAILPDTLIEQMGLVGKLSGSKKNRVKARMFKGTLSQGLLLHSKKEWNVGDDVKDELGIIKHSVAVPECMRGKAMGANTSITVKYDIENFKYFPNLIKDGEEVVITEKLHGTWMCATLLPQKHWFDRTFNELITPAVYDRETETLTPAVYGNEKSIIVDFFVGSKGLTADGIVFSLEENKLDNVYAQTAIRYNIKEKMKASQMVQELIKQDLPVHLIGEVFSFGIQDLGYSVDKDDPPKFRAFDAYVGLRHQGRFLNDDELNSLLKELDIQRVPILYKGPFSKEKVLELTSGKETVSGKEVHIREGVVVRTTQERKADEELNYSKTFNRGIKFDGMYGRVQLKSVSADYLTRKGNVTEHQ